MFAVTTILVVFYPYYSTDLIPFDFVVVVMVVVGGGGGGW